MRRYNVAVKRSAFFLPLACYYALAIPHFRYVPLWDSMENLEEYLFLPRQHLSFDNLLLMHNGHPALGYFWPFWIAQSFFPSNLLAVHVINVLIGSLAIIAFAQIARLVFSDAISTFEIALITCAFAVQPVFVAYAINNSPDYGVLAYFLATLWLLYAGRLGWAAVTGVLLIFSKETGLIIYLMLLGFYLIGGIRDYRWKRTWPLAIPLFVFALYAFYQRSKGEALFPWTTKWLSNESLWQIYLPNPFKWDFRMAALGPFILEFQWIFAVVILLGLAVALATQLPKRLSLTEIKTWVRSPLGSFVCLLLGCLYIVSRVVQWTNQRYFLVLYPLVLLAFFAALLQVNLRRKTRVIVLVASILLLLFCNFRTADPLSRKIAGVFRFGQFHMLSIATIRPDPGNLNRDELVYNLEHTHFSTLLDLAFAKIRPTEQTTIVMPADSWWVLARLDSQTFRRTESRRPPFIKIGSESPNKIAQSPNKPETLFVVAMPNLDNGKMMQQLAPFYEVKERHVFSDRGYELEVFEMTRKVSMVRAERTSPKNS